MNIKLLRAIKRHILEHPRTFDVNCVCETKCCFSGKAVVLSGETLGDNPSTVCDRAQELLQLTDRQAGNLFFDGPEFFQPAWKTTGTYISRAKLAAKRIEHFIATDGCE